MKEVGLLRREEVGIRRVQMARKEISCLRVLEDDKDMDVDYKSFVLNLLVEGERMELKKKPRKKYEEHDEEENDPQYGLFLKNLKKHGKSYMVEGEKNGSPIILTYEMDEPYNLEPIGILRSTMKQKTPPSDQMPGVEYQKKSKKEKKKKDFDYSTCLKSLKRQEQKERAGVEYQKKITKEKKEAVYNFDHDTYTKSLNRHEQKESAGLEYQKAEEGDYDYITYLGNVTAFYDHHVLKYGGLTVVYEPKDEKDGKNHHNSKYGGRKVVCEPKDEENDSESEDSDDGSFSDEDFMCDSKDEMNDHETEDSDDENYLDEESLGYTCDKKGTRVSMSPPKDGKKNRVKEEHSDGYSDVEILDSASYKMKGSLSPADSARHRDSKFRQRVMKVLSFPYNKSEYDRLWQDVKHRKPKERHLELRNGRERGYSVEKDGKSYLDYYPGLERKLLLAQGDRQKRLNLLRGFFFWLKYLQQPGSFCPWEDDECLAITPKSS